MEHQHFSEFLELSQLLPMEHQQFTEFLEKFAKLHKRQFERTRDYQDYTASMKFIIEQIPGLTQECLEDCTNKFIAFKVLKMNDNGDLYYREPEEREEFIQDTDRLLRFIRRLESDIKTNDLNDLTNNFIASLKNESWFRGVLHF